jgi:hypothetical protein
MAAAFIDPTQPTPMPSPSPDARLAAYQRLLEQGVVRNDAGGSNQYAADRLNSVDMGRSDRVAGMWDNRQKQYQSSGGTMLDDVGKAYEALRAKRAMGSGGGRRSGGGGSSSSALTAFDPYAAYQPWFTEDYLAGLTPIPARPGLPKQPSGATLRNQMEGRIIPRPRLNASGGRRVM